MQNRASVEGQRFFLSREIDHPVALLRLQCYQVEVQLVGDAVDIFVGQRMLPARIAEYGREILGDMFPGPQQRCKAVFPARKGDDDFHSVSR